MNNKVTCILSVFGLIAFGNTQVAPKIVLYDGVHQTGNILPIASTYVMDLATKNFDDRTQSVCATGTWLFYDKANYNEGVANAGMEWIFGPGSKFCSNLKTLGGSVSSLRYVGTSSDYRKDSITLFSGTYFQGQEEFFIESATRLVLKGSAKSFIITGTSGWTLYDQYDYKGNAVCVFPQPSSDFKPEFVPSTESIKIPHGTIKSLAKGCKK